MGVSDEALLIMKVQGRQEVEDLKKSVEQAEKALIAAKQAAIQAGQSTAQMAANLQQPIANLQALQAQLTASKNSLAALGTTPGAQKAAYYVSGLAQAAQDAQYGLKNVENNVLALTSAMGPWGVAIGIASAVSIELYTHWDDIAKLWGEGHTKTEAEMMEELGKATSRTAEEMKRLRDYERREAVEKAGAGPKKTEADLATAVAEAFRESGGTDKLAEQLALADAGGDFSAKALRDRANTDEQNRLRKADSVRLGRINPITGERSGGDAAKADAMEDAVLRDIKIRLEGAASDELGSAGVDDADLRRVADRLEAAGMSEAADKLRDIDKKRRFVGPPKPDYHDKEFMKDEMNRFNETGESDIIAGPGRFLQRQAEAGDKFQQELDEAADAQADNAFDRALDGVKRTFSKIRKKDAEKSKRALADFEATHPGEDDAAQDWMRRAATVGIAESVVRDFRAGYGKGTNSSVRYRGQTLDEMKDAVYAEELRRLKAAGVPLKDAEEQAEAFARKQVGTVMSRGQEALKDPNLWGPARSAQLMDIGSYADSLRTAKDGVFPEILEQAKKQTDAMIFLKEWARKNGNLGVQP